MMSHDLQMQRKDRRATTLKLDPVQARHLSLLLCRNLQTRFCISKYGRIRNIVTEGHTRYAVQTVLHKLVPLDFIFKTSPCAQLFAMTVWYVL